jgi:glucose-1-phosphate thymidylyltransferase
MNIIIPMAGRGTRLRPHTLTLPKPLLPIAGKPMVHRLVEDIVKVCGQSVNQIAYIIGRDFGQEVEKQLCEVALAVGSEGKIYYQDEKLGTAHAILCAADSLEGDTVVAFADTLFKADFTLDTTAEGIIWVQRVENPSAFGVIKLNEDGNIAGFVEKPQQFVSDMAIIGIYYFRDGAYLRSELRYLLDNDLKEKGEYQLTNALENMRAKGFLFRPQAVTEWLDCGNKEATVFTNQRYLDYLQGQQLTSPSAKLHNTVIIEPVFIGDDVEIHDSIIGPHVSVGKGCKISNSILKNSLIQENTTIQDANLKDSLFGNFVRYAGKADDCSLGDYTTVNL